VTGTGARAARSAERRPFLPPKTRQHVAYGGSAMRKDLPRHWHEVVAAVAVRPDLWVTALRQVLALAPSGWWRRRPFLPLPDAGYLAFRLQTMYGDARHPPAPDDVVAYLEWCRSHRQTLR
jgi:hypothetical protein